MAQSYYNTAQTFARDFQPGQSLPVISTQLDSVRAYQFEVHFYGLPQNRNTNHAQDLTLAAKQVSPGGISVESITVDRLNDKVYYPGKMSQEELTITFDHLYLRETAPTLWDWFKSVYDPITGNLVSNSRPGGANTPNFKAQRLEIVFLDNVKQPHAVLEYYGVYPMSFKPSELNYSTNEFHTIEVGFKYDFLDFKNEVTA